LKIIFILIFPYDFLSQQCINSILFSYLSSKSSFSSSIFPGTSLIDAWLALHPFRPTSDPILQTVVRAVFIYFILLLMFWNKVLLYSPVWA
jgi:hypothetical protein